MTTKLSLFLILMGTIHETDMLPDIPSAVPVRLDPASP